MITTTTTDMLDNRVYRAMSGMEILLDTPSELLTRIKPMFPDDYRSAANATWKMARAYPAYLRSYHDLSWEWECPLPGRDHPISVHAHVRDTDGELFISAGMSTLTALQMVSYARALQAITEYMVKVTK